MVNAALGIEWSKIPAEILGRFVDILKAPFIDPEMLWIIVPIILALVVLQLYFARYRHIQNDYYSALANAIFLLFVAADLLHYLAVHSLLFVSFVKTGIAILIIFIGAMLILIDFFRLLPARTIFKLSSKATFYFMAYMAIILVYSDIVTQNTVFSLLYNYISTLIAVLLCYILFQLAVTAIRVYVPESRDATQTVITSTEDELEEIAHKAEEIKEEQRHHKEESLAPKPTQHHDLEDEKKQILQENIKAMHEDSEDELYNHQQTEIHSAINEATEKTKYIPPHEKHKHKRKSH